MEEALADPGPRPLKASVVVCAYGQASRLAETLLSLARQTMPSADYEVIVVDNNLDGGPVGEMVSDLRTRSYSQRPERLRYVHCPIRGLSHARNAGISGARGEIVCFIDDDAVACQDWLERIEHAFWENPGAGAIGGHILLNVPDPRPKVLKEGLEPYWSQFITANSGYTEVDDWNEFPWGANWSARRNVLLEIGGFRTSYGRRGRDYWGGEELVAAAQIRSLGYKVAVLPQAQVLHNVDASRFHLGHIWRTILASTLVTYQAQRDLYMPANSARGSNATQVKHSPGSPLSSGKGSSVQDSDAVILVLRIAAQLILATRRLRDFCIDWLHSLAPSLH